LFTALRDKDSTIVEVARRLARTLEGIPVDIADHWDADRFAFGIARTDRPSQLAYISTWEQPRGTYYLELETGDPDSVASDFRVVDKREALDFDELASRVRRHLLEDPGDG